MKVFFTAKNKRKTDPAILIWGELKQQQLLWKYFSYEMVNIQMTSVCYLTLAKPPHFGNKTSYYDVFVYFNF